MSHYEALPDTPLPCVRACVRTCLRTSSPMSPSPRPLATHTAHVGRSRPETCRCFNACILLARHDLLSRRRGEHPANMDLLAPAGTASICILSSSLTNTISTTPSCHHRQLLFTKFHRSTAARNLLAAGAGVLARATDKNDRSSAQP